MDYVKRVLTTVLGVMFGIIGGLYFVSYVLVEEGDGL